MNSNQNIETQLIKAVKLLLDDPNGISDEAYIALMEYVYLSNPESKAIEYLASTESFKGRKFLNEDFELN